MEKMHTMVKKYKNDNSRFYEIKSRTASQNKGKSSLTFFAKCMKQTGLFVFFVLILILSFSCNKNSETDSKPIRKRSSESKIIIGFSQIGAESAWRTCNTKSMQDAALDAGIQLIFSNGEQKQENQIKAIRSFIVYQVDVIIFCPIVQEGWDNVLREAKEAKIPVIIVDRKIVTEDESLYAGYLGTDSVDEGRDAAHFLQRRFANRSHVRAYNILELRGTDGSSAADGRYSGFREVLEGDKNFEIIYSESGDFLRSRGKEIVQTILEKNGKLQIDGKPIDIIFSHNDAMTLGVLEVLDSYGIHAGHNLTIVSIDAEQAAIDALKEGKINCVVECNPKLGPSVMQLVRTLMYGNTIPRLVHLEKRVFTDSENLSGLEDRGY